MEATLGVVTVEDNAVDSDGDDFHNNLDKSADECPVL